MRNLRTLATALVLLMGASRTWAQSLDSWPQWRGPLGTGAAPAGNPPVKWDQNTNIKWKMRIPGDGTSTPIIWGDQIFIQTAVSTKGDDAPALNFDQGKGKGPPPGKGPPGEKGKGPKGEFGKGPPMGGKGKGGPPPSEPYQFILICLDRSSGQPLWKKVCREEVPHEGIFWGNGSFAAASAMTDGEHVYAFFGSRGLYCYDMAGNLKWEKDFGKQQTRNGFGEGTTPALFGNTIVVQWDHDGGAGFAAAIDKRSGKELWRKERNEKTVWSTPVIADYGGKGQVVLGATNSVRSYDLATGKPIWETEGLTVNVIPTGFASNGIAYLTSGYTGSKLLAIKLGGTGDLTGTKNIAWRYDRDTPYVPSPLLSGDRIYFLKLNNAILTCLDAKTGKPHYSAQRIGEIGSDVYASPVAADGHVYLTGRNGTTVVIKDADKFEVVSTNVLGDPMDASPAIVGKQLFLRSRQNLYCIEEK